MMKQAKTNKPDELHEPAAVLEAVPATALDSPARPTTPSSWPGNGSW